jgi:two-component system sensor histidine kinase KdpD
LGTDTLPGTGALYLPLRGGARVVGVLGYRPADRRLLDDVNQRQMLEALAHQAAGALERALLADEAKQTELRVRTEELRNTLLSSVSHDLRTPLAAIVGCATTLLGSEGMLTFGQRTDLLHTIQEEAERLGRLVANLLAMTRLESGSLGVSKEWVPLEELVGAALGRLQTRLAARHVDVRIPVDFPLLHVDPLLIEQVLINLIENAICHTPPATPIEIVAAVDGGAVQIDLADRGPGLAGDAQGRLFEKFYRGPGAPPGGSGLGLAICSGMVAAHAGTIEAYNRPGGGAVFRLRLPIPGPAPHVPAEPASGATEPG